MHRFCLQVTTTQVDRSTGAVGLGTGRRRRGRVDREHFSRHRPTVTREGKCNDCPQGRTTYRLGRAGFLIAAAVLALGGRSCGHDSFLVVVLVKELESSPRQSCPPQCKCSVEHHLALKPRLSGHHSRLCRTPEAFTPRHLGQFIVNHHNFRLNVSTPPVTENPLRCQAVLDRNRPRAGPWRGLESRGRVAVRW